MIEVDLISDMVKRRAEIFAGISQYDKAPLIRQDRMFEFAKATLDDAIQNPAFIVNGLTQPKLKDMHRDEDGLFCLPFPSFVVVVNDKTPYVIAIEDASSFTTLTEYDQTIVAQAITFKDKKWRPQLPFSISMKKGFDGIYTMLQCSDVIIDEVYEQLASMFKFFNTTSDAVNEMSGVDQFIDGLYGQLASAIYSITTQAEVMFRPASQKPPTLMQVAKSKKPLWEYRLVKLDSVRQIPGAPRGGHHESPRWHMVRGHWRNLKSGKTVFIRSHEKGDKSKGIIEKDYERKAA